MAYSMWETANRSARLVCAFVVSFAAVPALQLVAAESEKVDFNRDIRPILSDRCFHCHGPDRKSKEAEETDLRLDLPESVFDEHGAIEPGDADGSELMARIISDDPDLRMPPASSHKPALTTVEIERFRLWIEQGAEYQPHWAYVAPKNWPDPEVKGKNWPASWIDRFVLARLDAEGLRPSKEADRVTLIRRLSFDLTGLPPSPNEVDAFVNDKSPDAYKKLVDRLLDSPHYGERMAIWWLDLVRYADTVGYHGDQDHNVSPYRDWVIWALNENMPFDQFTRWQLAGDLLATEASANNSNSSEEIMSDMRLASAYNRLLQTSHEGGVQLKEYRAIYRADRIRNLSQVWMGATMGCSQCHDHKYDPYTTHDFYSIGAFFADIDDEEHLRNQYKGLNTLPTRRLPEMDLLSPLDRQRAKALDRQLATEKEEAELARLQAERAAIKPRRVMVSASSKPHEVRVLPRGNWLDETGEIVPPAVPQFLGKTDSGDRRATRLDLANWLTTSHEKGGVAALTTRVQANRFWALLMGGGIAAVLDDFGGQGEPPVHPELLDRLGLEFLQSGWDIKHMMKLIVMSRTYRQSSVSTPALRKRDPNNRLYACQSRPRLPAEMIRDNALAISGLLARDLGGPSVKPYQPAAYYSHLNFPKRKYQHQTGRGQWRRGLYVHWQRQFLHPMLRAFDAPTREECTAQRPISNTPTAALNMLNDPTFVEAARVFAARIVREGGASDADRLKWAFRQTVSRDPNDLELGLLAKLLAMHREHFDSHPDEARKTQSAGSTPVAEGLEPGQLASWTSVTRALLNLNETITRN
jgi:hypothetical protein